LAAFVKLAAIAALPLGLFAAVPVANSRRMNWQDGVVLLWLYIPVQFHLTSGIWNVPVNLDFMARLFIVGVGAWAFLIVRGVEDAGYDFLLSGAILRDAAISFVGFSVIAIPLGFAMRFLAWNPQWRGLPQFVADYLTIFLFVAIAEEMFFRGLLQNLLEGSIGSRNVAQAMVSVAFGFSHIQHAPAPNWRYVALATVAGWFYGLAYRKHRSLMASAGTHAMVDTLWRTFLTLP
jgi:membrane protease YdiL (CAAX protease family)